MVNSTIKSTCRRSRSRYGIVVALAICGLLLSSPASAQTYPISGVWIATTSSNHFPGTIMGACFSLKTFGLDAVLHQPFPELIIFSGSKRFVVRENHKTEAVIRSIRNTLGGTFQITESLGRRGKWLPWSDRNSYNVKILGPATIDLTEGKRTIRLVKCSQNRTDL